MSDAHGKRGTHGRSNLPSELTAFIGRDAELAVLRPRLQEVRLLSLLGPAGIGKTRLALRLAAMVQRQFADGVWVVQLAPLTDGDLLPGVIAGVLGITEARPGETLAVLGETLSARNMLLVLDNCEHLVDRVAVVLDRLLRTCSRLTVLATSQKRIGLGGEQTWRVPPLQLPDRERAYAPDDLEEVEAIALFVDRARRANAAFSITRATMGDVVDLVRRLDGVPLAVELAAGWMEALSPAELGRELDRRYELLVARGQVVSDGDLGLWASIESSYERLDPRAQDLLRQLAVFAGGCNLGGVTAVTGLPSSEAIEILGLLVDHSFVTAVPAPQGPTRYRLLEVLRQFALARLEESGQHDAVRRRFAEHVVRLAETASASLTTREGPRWMVALDLELDNLRAVLGIDATWAVELQARLAVAMIPYWHSRGLFDEGRQRLDGVLALMDGESTATVTALNGLSWLSWAQGEVAGAQRLARRALRIAWRIGDERGTAYALLRLAQARFDAARLEAARRATDRTAEIAARLRDRRLMAECVLQLGQIALVEGRPEEAEPLLRESVSLFSQIGLVDREAVALMVLARLRLKQGRPTDAEEALRQALVTIGDFALVRHSVPALESFAAVAADRGDHDRAATLMGAVGAILDRMGARPPGTAPLRGGLIARWQEALDAPGADRAFAAGGRMGLQEAIAFALGGTAPATPLTRRVVPAGPALTRRQLEVARLVAEARSNKEIAARLHVSERTVEGHIEQIFNRLGMNSRVQLTAWVLRNESDH